MQTHFTAAQLTDPDIRDADGILRKCVHCGFCNATCPTFRILGDELDGPRGRIYLIKDMLENNRQPGPSVVKHLDRCLSCLGCMSTCPSGVNYMHLVDHGRNYMQRRRRRPAGDRLMRALLVRFLTRPALMRSTLPLVRLARFVRPFVGNRLGAILQLAGIASSTPSARPLQTAYATPGRCLGTVALLPGCVQRAVNNDINLATIRLLNRLGYSVRVLNEIACCGAVEQHLGEGDRVSERLRENVRKWKGALAETGVSALIVNASGCGTMLKDYGHLLRADAVHANAGARMSAKVMDVSEFLAGCELGGLPIRDTAKPVIAYQNPCSMRHGQNITTQPFELLKRFGFDVREPPEKHLCCGSAGTYNLLQPELSKQLGRNKAQNIQSLRPQVVASGNLGCMLQLRLFLPMPVVHTAQLLDWASGGPCPPEFDRS